MAVGSHYDVARGNIAPLWHHLVADTFLQNVDALLVCKSSNVAMQGRGCNRRCRDDVVEDDMRPLRIEDTSAITLYQFTKCLNCQWRRGVMTHHTINIHYDSLTLFDGTTQLVAENFFT